MLIPWHLSTSLPPSQFQSVVPVDVQTDYCSIFHLIGTATYIIPS